MWSISPSLPPSLAFPRTCCLTSNRRKKKKWVGSISSVYLIILFSFPANGPLPKTSTKDIVRFVHHTQQRECSSPIASQRLELFVINRQNEGETTSLQRDTKVLFILNIWLRYSGQLVFGKIERCTKTEQEKGRQVVRMRMWWKLTEIILAALSGRIDIIRGLSNIDSLSSCRSDSVARVLQRFVGYNTVDF